MAAPASLRRAFVGPQGIRAGWGWGLGGVAALAALIAALGGLRVAGWALSGAPLARAAVLWAIAMTLIGLAEEFAFRGYPQFTLASGIGFWRAAALLSLVFGGLHYFLKPMENLADFASVGLIGLFLCLTLRRTGSLWFAVGFHAGFDRSEEHTSELQSPCNLVCRLL